MAKEGVSQVKKTGKKTLPLSRKSLYLIATGLLYTIFLSISGAFCLILLLSHCMLMIGGTASVKDLGIAVLLCLAFTCFMLALCCLIVGGRKIPPYRYFRKHGVHFPACLKGKRLTQWDAAEYIYWDDHWFVAAMNMAATAVNADLIDFSVPVTRLLSGGHGSYLYHYHFRTKDRQVVTLCLADNIKPFNRWVKAHGGKITQILNPERIS